MSSQPVSKQGGALMKKASTLNNEFERLVSTLPSLTAEMSNGIHGGVYKEMEEHSEEISERLSDLCSEVSFFNDAMFSSASMQELVSRGVQKNLESLNDFEANWKSVKTRADELVAKSDVQFQIAANTVNEHLTLINGNLKNRYRNVTSKISGALDAIAQNVEKSKTRCSDESSTVSISLKSVCDEIDKESKNQKKLSSEYMISSVETAQLDAKIKAEDQKSVRFQAEFSDEESVDESGNDDVDALYAEKERFINQENNECLVLENGKRDLQEELEIVLAELADLDSMDLDRLQGEEEKIAADESIHFVDIEKISEAELEALRRRDAELMEELAKIEAEVKKHDDEERILQEYLIISEAEVKEIQNYIKKSLEEKQAIKSAHVSKKRMICSVIDAETSEVDVLKQQMIDTINCNHDMIEATVKQQTRCTELEGEIAAAERGIDEMKQKLERCDAAIRTAHSYKTPTKEAQPRGDALAAPYPDSDSDEDVRSVSIPEVEGISAFSPATKEFKNKLRNAQITSENLSTRAVKSSHAIRELFDNNDSICDSTQDSLSEGSLFGGFQNLRTSQGKSMKAVNEEDESPDCDSADSQWDDCLSQHSSSGRGTSDSMDIDTMMAEPRFPADIYLKDSPSLSLHEDSPPMVLSSPPVPAAYMDDMDDLSMDTDHDQSIWEA